MSRGAHPLRSIVKKWQSSALRTSHDLTPIRASCTLKCMTQTGVIERMDRVRDGQVSTFIATLVAAGHSHRQIAEALDEQFGIGVDRTTVLRYIQRQRLLA